MTIPCIASRILIVDLSSEQVREKPMPDLMVEKYLGGRGIAAQILWDETDRNTDPLGPENVLIFSTGTLMGTHAPCAGKTTVTTKGPATNMYLKSSVGGRWGPKVKSAGYDIVVVKGKSRKPVYLLIDGREVHFKNAEHLWGGNTQETTRRIQDELSDQSVEVACIGPAGENMVLFSSIMFSMYCASGRGGTGAVMGSKNLKALAVRGKVHFRAANQEQFDKSIKRCRELIRNDSSFPVLSEFGTSGILMRANEQGTVGTRNFREGAFEKARKTSISMVEFQWRRC